MTSIAADAPAEVQAFRLGEDVRLTFELDDGTADDEPELGAGDFEDPLGTLSITGLVSGAVLDFGGGVDFFNPVKGLIEVNVLEFGPVPPQVPLPAALPLLAAGLGLLQVLSRRRA
ncbi:MAG: hypothetical protein AAFX81_00440 [Pseudomonadota bacterium]